MKETAFIQQNKAKWERFEKVIYSETVDPKELGELYTEINADLSYAETFYKHRTVRAYLNFLAQRIHAKLYKQKRTPIGKVWNEWSLMIPLELFRARKNLLFAFVLFCLWALIGAVSTYLDEGFVQLILGSNYVEMTEELIAEGNPMGVYGQTEQSEMFFSITINNIQVALLCFFGGVFFSLGTHILLFNNAIMLGAFQYFFHLKGLLLTSFLAVWIHGAFEISAIVVASAAGFTVGHGLLFPGSYTRMQSFQLSAMRGVRIMLSLIPVFVIAGFLESFVTRHYQTLPDWSKWLIIIFSFSIMLLYYVVYPIIVARKHPELVYNDPPVIPLKPKPLEVHKIKQNKEIIGDLLRSFSAKAKLFMPPILRYALPIMLGLQLVQIIIHYDDMNVTYFYDWSAQLSILFGNPYAITFNGWTDILVGFAWTLPLTIMSAAVLYSFSEETPTKKKTFQQFFNTKKLRIFLITSGLYLFVYFLPYHLLLLSFFVVPFFFLVLPSAGLSSHKKYISNGLKLSKRYWTKSFGMLVALALFIGALAQPIALVFSIDFKEFGPAATDLLDMLTGFVERLLVNQTSFATGVANIIRQVVYLSFLILVIPLVFAAAVLLYYSANEEVYATGLWEKYKKFGKRSRVKESLNDYDE